MSRVLFNRPSVRGRQPYQSYEGIAGGLADLAATGQGCPESVPGP